MSKPNKHLDIYIDTNFDKVLVALIIFISR